METQSERQIIPTAHAIFVQDMDGRSPEVKRCGYCDGLVRWTSIEGRNVAVNCDGSRHQCIAGGTAKRKQPVKHARPTPDEVSEFLVSGKASSQKLLPQQDRPEYMRDSEAKALHDAKTEAIHKLAEGMLKVAESNGALAQSNKRLAKTYGRLARAMERARYSVR